VGHSRYRKQSLDFIAITGVDAKYISDGETMSRPLDYPDLITRLYAPLDDQSEVRPWSQCLGELARERLIVHPNSKPPARDSWFGPLKNSGANLPALTDERAVHLNLFGGEILAKLAVSKRSADLLLPPSCIFQSVRVDHFVGSAMGLS